MSETAAGNRKINSVIDIIRAEKAVPDTVLDEILEEARITGKKPANLLVSRGYITKNQLLQFVAKQLRVEYRDLSEKEIDRSLAKTMSVDFARRHNIVPIEKVGKSTLIVAVPIKYATSLDLNDTVRHRTKFTSVEFVVSPESQIQDAIKEIYRADEELEQISLAAAEEDVSTSDVASLEEDEVISDESDIEKFVRLAITQAIDDRASDILFESEEDGLSLRYRIDGMWHERQKAPKNIADEIISVVKIMAELDISIRKKAQDGRLSVVHQGNEVDLRVNIFPIQDGENITMRILDNTQANLRLEDLGFNDKNLEMFMSAIKKPQGLILVTGPTGSGKSVTLYSGLNVIANKHNNTYTIEDPIEYRIDNVKQSQINKKAGWTYPEAIRAFMRAAPDNILVGEIRDLETASMALQAGMTGHLVLSTLHTNSAAEAPARLADMGVEAHVTAATLTAVVAQRLVRRLCGKCKVPHTPTRAELLAFEFPWEEGEELPQLYKPSENGCKECSFIGFKGRTAAHEILLVNDEIRALIAGHAQSYEIEEAAIRNGMSKMKDDGFQKVLTGITTIPEVLNAIV